MKRFDRVTINENAIGLNREAMQFAGFEAIVLQINGDMVTLAIDHDNDVTTEPIIVTVRTKYIKLASRLWAFWLAIRRLFK